MSGRGCGMGLLVFVLAGLGVLVPIGIFGIVTLGVFQYNSLNARFRENGVVRVATVVERGYEGPEGRSIGRGPFLLVEDSETGERFGPVFVQQTLHSHFAPGDTVTVWVLDGKARVVVESNARVPIPIWLVLAVVPLSLIGLFLIFRAAIRPSCADLGQGSPGVLEAARIGRRAARSMVVGRRPEDDPHEN